MYNRHQYPFVALNVAVASGKNIVNLMLFLKHTADFLDCKSIFCYFRVCGCERNPRQTTDFPSGRETLAGYSEELTYQHV